MLKRYWYRDFNLDNVKSKSDLSLLLHPDLQTLLIANSETLVAQLFDFGPASTLVLSHLSHLMEMACVSQHTVQCRLTDN